jgi:integrase/recombinase XerD
MRLSEAVHGYLLSISAGNYSQSTIRLYRHYLDLFAEHLQNPELSDITAEHVTKFAAWLRRDYCPNRPGNDQRPLSACALRNVWSAVRSFYNWAETTLDASRPDAKWPRPRGSGRSIQPFSPEEVKALVSATQYTAEAKTTGRAAFSMRRPTARRDRALVLLLLDTGLRVSETSRLCVHNLSVETGEVHVQPHGTRRKTRGRTVFLGRASRLAVWRYLAERDALADGLLFVTRAGRPMTRYHIHHTLQRLGERADVSNVHPHRFRHTFAIQYLRACETLARVRKLIRRTPAIQVNIAAAGGQQLNVVQTQSESEQPARGNILEACEKTHSEASG